MVGIRTYVVSTTAALLIAGVAASGSGAVSGGGQYIVVLKDGSDASAVAARHGKKYGADVSFVYKHALKGYAAKLSAGGLASVQADPDVAFVSEDHAISAAGQSPFLPPPNPQPAQQVSYGVDRIDGDLSSTVSGDGSGSVNVNVAVLDSGIESDHPDLSVMGGVDCARGNTGFEDQNGHGTSVAGFIGARDNAIGVAGVAPGARLWAVRVLDKNLAGSVSNEICGIDWVTSTHTDTDPTNDIVVANMSLSGPVGHAGDDDNCGRTVKNPEHQALCRSVAAGVTYVVAAGNDATDFQAVSPATYGEVLTATAIADYDGRPGGLTSPTCASLGTDDSAASFSNFATIPIDQAHTIAAPGVCIGSTFPTQNYTIWYGGTSFATPLVAGTVALCIYSGPCAGMTPGRIVQKMVADATAYNTKKKNAGYGFQGDALRPIGGKYYGYLINAGSY